MVNHDLQDWRPTNYWFICFIHLKNQYGGFKLKKKKEKEEKDEGNMWGGFSTSMDYHKFGFGT